MKPSPVSRLFRHQVSGKRTGAVGALLLVVLLLGSTVACGYRLAGQSSILPAGIKTIGIPIFINRTKKPELEQRITEHIIDEFVTRGRVRIVPDENGAEAILYGTIFTYTTVPVLINEQGRATRYEIMITARVVLNMVTTDEILWATDHFLFKQQYEVPDIAAIYSDREIVAIDEVSTDFARSVVSSILEGF
jgi:hypothetical protein